MNFLYVIHTFDDSTTGLPELFCLTVFKRPCVSAFIREVAKRTPFWLSPLVLLNEALTKSEIAYFSLIRPRVKYHMVSNLLVGLCVLL